MTEPAKEKTFRPLWYEPFLQQLKKKLNYPLDIGKYSQLLNWTDNARANGSFSIKELYAVCRLLFLENYEHAQVFDEIFYEYISREIEYEEAKMNFRRKGGEEKPAPTTGPTTGTGGDETVKPLPGTDAVLAEEPPEQTEEETLTTAIKYLNLVIPLTEEQVTTAYPVTTSGSSFVLTDAYLPLTKREMTHGWRHLRKKVKYRPGNRLDVRATVQQIATEGILLQPVFEKEQVNGDNILLILADRRGSMQPFHKLTDKLIDTAIKDGGHRNALVYYFYNCPVDYVYKNKNLTEPVALTDLYSRIRPDQTNVLIISDAGAARGNMNEYRVSKTRAFLYGTEELTGLHKAALFVGWLNPMPRHRWKYSTASALSRYAETPMYSIMDDGYSNFLRVIDKLMGK